MNRLILVLALGAAATLAGCDNFQTEAPDLETAPPPTEAPVAPAVEDAAAPAADSAVDAPPADTTALPPEKRTSEETVKPESETLFY